MKKYILKSILFISPVLILALVLELMTRNIPNDYALKNKLILNKADDIEVLILGNSHSFYGINPQYFSKKTFNLAFRSQSIEYDYRLWKRYEPKLKKNKIIILPISFFTLYSRIESFNNSWLVKFYNIYMGLNTSFTPKDNFEIFSSKVEPLIKKNYYYYTSDTSDCISDENGWCKRSGSKNFTKIKEQAIEAYNRHISDTVPHFDDNIKILDKLLKEANDKGIQVIMITSPNYKFYADTVSKSDRYIKMQNALNALDKKYNQAIYINSMFDKRFIDSDFYDGDHLNEQGAKKYSIFLDSVVNNITKKE